MVIPLLVITYYFVLLLCLIFLTKEKFEKLNNLPNAFIQISDMNAIFGSFGKYEKYIITQLICDKLKHL